MFTFIYILFICIHCANYLMHHNYKIYQILLLNIVVYMKFMIAKTSKLFKEILRNYIYIYISCELFEMTIFKISSIRIYSAMNLALLIFSSAY